MVRFQIVKGMNVHVIFCCTVHTNKFVTKSSLTQREFHWVATKKIFASSNGPGREMKIICHEKDSRGALGRYGRLFSTPRLGNRYGEKEVECL